MGRRVSRHARTRLHRLQEGRHGEFRFGCVNAGLDCEFSPTTVHFTWQGFDEMDEVCGDGFAEINDDGTLNAEIAFHLGDEATFKAKKW